MKKLAIIFFGVFAMATSAKAVVYDFVAAEASLVSEGGWADLGGDDIAALAGLSITGTSGGAAAFAYLDGPSGGFAGGLGVCDALDGGDGTACTDSSHDSVSTAESDILKITLLAPNQTITDITFNPGGQHGPSSLLDGLFVDYRLKVGGVLQAWVEGIATFDGLSGILALISDVNSIELKESATNSREFYVATMTVVPLPAAVWLFGTAMLGLFGMRRKAKMGAVAA